MASQNLVKINLCKYEAIQTLEAALRMHVYSNLKRTEHSTKFQKNMIRLLKIIVLGFFGVLVLESSPPILISSGHHNSALKRTLFKEEKVDFSTFKTQVTKERNEAKKKEFLCILKSDSMESKL